MRRATCSIEVLLNGDIAGPDGACDWTAPDDEVFNFLADEIREVGAEIAADRTYSNADSGNYHLVLRPMDFKPVMGADVHEDAVFDGPRGERASNGNLGAASGLTCTAGRCPRARINQRSRFGNPGRRS
ncbi:MAG: hypothetical protein M0Z91_00185 [Actinomycetota bacterium]|nr:hypothetical protein [Actinomycetota bacterium]